MCRLNCNAKLQSVKIRKTCVPLTERCFENVLKKIKQNGRGRKDGYSNIALHTIINKRSVGCTLYYYVNYNILYKHIYTCL